MNQFSEKLFSKTPIVGILRGYDKETVLSISRVFVNPGFTNLEVTKNSPNDYGIIEELVAEFEGKLNIGCGTILSIKDARKAIKVGASFIVTPIVEKKVIKYCVKKICLFFQELFHLQKFIMHGNGELKW
ncbi:hypothetical protein EGM88_04480 [Aureibaculum marinum]|uniref:Bifunctional 4-hydroxy-2-oxoglutarate aldolase/2-dehydro-3-deoxy-phosphogluconate aldolase n=1 Tax=Aureibaculum marinum TaxID=2487930 RepID=A0A3N4NS01_9FLAO|nr:hypothetical protein EGM88_04480 [Aureibaculum marinum]